MFDYRIADNVAQQIKAGIKAPYVTSQVSTLGGTENVSVLFFVSLDPKESWHYGIRENSRYLHFHLSGNGRIEQFRRNYTINAKYRTRTVKDIKHLIGSINKYLLTI